MPTVSHEPTTPKATSAGDSWAGGEDGFFWATGGGGRMELKMRVPAMIRVAHESALMVMSGERSRTLSKWPTECNENVVPEFPKRHKPRSHEATEPWSGTARQDARLTKNNLYGNQHKN